MEKDYLDNNLLVERYLRGELSAEEQTAFEEALLCSVDLVDQVESAELLQKGLRDVANLEQAHSAASTTSRFAALFNSPRYAMAASFLLLVSLGLSGTLLYQRGALDVPVMSTQIVPLVTVRGAPGDQAVNTLKIAQGNEQTVLMLDPGFEPYTRYRATIYRIEAGNEPARVVQVDGLTPGYEEMLALSLSSRGWKPGDYEVAIEGWRDEWPAGHAFDLVDTIPLRVVPSDN